MQPVHDEQDEQKHNALRDRKRQVSSEYQELSQELGFHGVFLSLSEESFDLDSPCNQSVMSRTNSSTMGTNNERNTASQDMVSTPFR
jgi:hypothetical protein